MATENQELIAKEITLTLIEKNYPMTISTKDANDAATYNKKIGEVIGELYSAVLSSVVEADKNAN